MIELTITSTGLNFHTDLTDRIAQALTQSSSADGLAGVFAHGSTVGLTLMRYEPGAVEDLQRALTSAAPDDRTYLHALTTGDPNGFSHVRSSLLGTSLLVPWRDGALAMSHSHRIVLFDFDLKPADRRVIIDPPRPATNSPDRVTVPERTGVQR